MITRVTVSLGISGSVVTAGVCGSSRFEEKPVVLLSGHRQSFSLGIRLDSIWTQALSHVDWKVSVLVLHGSVSIPTDSVLCDVNVS